MTPSGGRPAATPAGQPHKISRYRIVERLGKGAMGVVYRAEDEAMGRDVAVKVLTADFESEPEARLRFYREARSAGRLLHRNIITIYDLGEEAGRLFIVMELLEGEPLAELLKRGEPAALEDKVDLMLQVLDGLSAAHAHGIYHRDIKPGNLFVLADGSLKILDFGVARVSTSTMTASGYIIGTPDYMSPEQSRGKEVDARSDIFSASAVFYYLLAGSRPFVAPDLPSLLWKVQLEDPPPIEAGAAPPALERIVLRGLAKDPASRYQSCGEMHAELSRFLRYYEADTRRLAVRVLEMFRAVQGLAGQRRAGIAGSGEEPAATRVQAIVNECPLLAEPDPDPTALAQLKRPRLAGVLGRLEELRRELGGDADRQPPDGTAKPSWWKGGLLGRARSARGQTTTEWLMIAGILTAIAVFLLMVVPDALRTYHQGIAWGVRTIAP